MVPIADLVVPILVAAVLVFVVSSLVWMVLPHHKSEWKGVPREDALRAALGDVPPGLYTVPHVSSTEQMKSPEIQAKLEEGPVAYVTVAPKGPPNMGKNLALWFVYAVFVGVIVAYVTGRALAPGAEYLAVFQISGTVAWAAYGFSVIGDAIWFAKPWSSVAKHLVDALLYGLVTAGAFGWLWPV